MSFKWLDSYNISLCSLRSEVVELVWRNNTTHASERQHSDDDYLNNHLVSLSTAMWRILFIAQDIYSDSTWGTLHCNLVVLIRNKTIRTLMLLLFWMCRLGYMASSVTVVTSLLMLSMLLCGERLWRQGCSASERKKWDLGAVSLKFYGKVHFIVKSRLPL